MLQELIINQGIDFQIIRGVSVGALNGSFLAQASMQGNSVDNLRARVEDLDGLWRNDITGNDSVYKKRLLGFAGIVVGADSVNSLDPLEELVDRHVSVDALRTSGREFKVGTVSLVNGEYREWSPGVSDFMERLIERSPRPASL